MSSKQVLEPPILEASRFGQSRFGQPLFEHLARSRELLATSPLIPSLELALTPLSEAAQMLSAGDLSLTVDERERLAMELAGVRQLLEGLGQWLSSRGALTPTYNCHAELDVLPWGHAPLSGGSDPAAGALSGAPAVRVHRSLSVEG